MCAYFSQSLKIKMSKNIVKIAMQFLLNLVLLYKNQKLKNTPQNLLHVLFIFGRASNKLLSGFSHFAIRSFFRFTFVTLQNFIAGATIPHAFSKFPISLNTLSFITFLSLSNHQPYFPKYLNALFM